MKAKIEAAMIEAYEAAGELEEACTRARSTRAGLARAARRTEQACAALLALLTTGGFGSHRPDPRRASVDLAGPRCPGSSRPPASPRPRRPRGRGGV